MGEKKLKALTPKLTKSLKIEANFNIFPRMLTKFTVEMVLNTKLTEHLGHENNALKPCSNTRNSYFSKTLLCADGAIELNTLHGRKNPSKRI